MDTLLEKVPFREDGTLDINEIMRLELERTVNAIMDAQADELVGEGNRRNGYRERKLATDCSELPLCGQISSPSAANSRCVVKNASDFL